MTDTERADYETLVRSMSPQEMGRLISAFSSDLKNLPRGPEHLDQFLRSLHFISVRLEVVTRVLIEYRSRH